jgi:hypothetical protein
MTSEPKTGADIGLGGVWADAEIISAYTRDQAIEDGELVDVTEWASADKGFLGGFTCPVAFTRALWDLVEVQPKSRKSGDTRGRAHDVLFMCSLAVRAVLRRGDTDTAYFRVIIGNRKRQLRATIDGDGVTIGFPEDF